MNSQQRPQANSQYESGDKIYTTLGLSSPQFLYHKFLVSLIRFQEQAVAYQARGVAFYSGWGLTHDRHELQRRQARPDILGLIHACPPEVVVERLAAAADLPQACYLRPLAKIQGVFASQAHLWRNMR